MEHIDFNKFIQWLPRGEYSQMHRKAALTNNGCKDIFVACFGPKS